MRVTIVPRDREALNSEQRIVNGERWSNVKWYEMGLISIACPLGAVRGSVYACKNKILAWYFLKKDLDHLFLQTVTLDSEMRLPMMVRAKGDNICHSIGPLLGKVNNVMSF